MKSYLCGCITGVASVLGIWYICTNKQKICKAMKDITTKAEQMFMQGNCTCSQSSNQQDSTN